MPLDPIPTPLGLAIAGLLGLVIGSFLNVVIYRLPKMMERQWADECAHLQGQAAAAGPVFNLMQPPSHCPTCASPVTWRHNLPVLSYLWLRGRCAACGQAMGLRYPLVELLTAALFAAVYWQQGATLGALAWSGFVAALVALAFIDWDTTLLPDDITLPLLWAGLVWSAWHGGSPTLHDALWGAVGGYLSLWSVYWAFKLLTGKEGMGHGDFKLFAALGAWLGWQALIPLILLASVGGALLGLVLRHRGGLREGGYLPFGPFLSGAGVAVMLLGPERTLAWLG
jgi:leader peptidase (prepilin peptidase) / N-methyltransferase